MRSRPGQEECERGRGGGEEQVGGERAAQGGGEGSGKSSFRSLADASPSQIRGLVRSLIKERVADGQLDESRLTFREVTRVQESLANNLVGLFHSRIEYPEIEELAAAKQKAGNNNRKQAEKKGAPAGGEEVRSARPGLGGDSA